MVKSLSSKIIKQDPGVSMQSYVLSDVVPDMRVQSEIAKESDIDEARLSRIEKEAYRRGFHGGEEAGRDAGLAMAHKEVGSLVKTASRLVDELKRTRHEIMERSEEEMVKLSLAIARSVIHAEPAINRELVLSVSKAAIKKLTVRDNVKLRLNPRDAEYMSGRKPELLSFVDGVKELTIEEDPSIAEGGCIVEAGLAEVDARLDQQLDEIMRGLMKGIEGHD